jgi:hypothetical protein
VTGKPGQAARGGRIDGVASGASAGGGGGGELRRSISSFRMTECFESSSCACTRALFRVPSRFV